MQQRRKGADLINVAECPSATDRDVALGDLWLVRAERASDVPLIKDALGRDCPDFS
jgi:hypothetical protein